MSSATNSRYRMIDSMFRKWVADLEDTNLMQQWGVVLLDRMRQLNGERQYTREQLVDGLRRCQPGDPLYAEKRVKIGADLYPIVYFYRWQPIKKLLWVSARRVPGSLRSLKVDDVYFHQLARTELAVRRRVPVTPKPATAKPTGPFSASPPDRNPLDDLPF